MFGEKAHLHQGTLDLTIRRSAFTESPSSNGINLVHKDDTRLMFPSICKHFSDESGGFTNVLVHDLQRQLQFLLLAERGKLTAEDTTLRKLVLRVAATARARSVLPTRQLGSHETRTSVCLPVPGGPYSKTPFGGLIPTRFIISFETTRMIGRGANLKELRVHQWQFDNFTQLPDLFS